MAITTTEAVANRVLLALYAENSADGYGNPTTSADFHTLRYSVDGLEAQESSVVSAEVVADRRTDSIVRTDFSVNSPVTMEMTHPRDGSLSTAYEQLITGAMFASSFGTQQTTDSVTDMDITAATGVIDFNASLPAPFPAVGDVIKIASAAAAGNNNYFVVQASATPNVTVSNRGGMVDVTGDSADVTILGKINEGTTLCSMGIERHYQNGLSTLPFTRYNGLVVDRWARDIPVDGIGTDSFTFLGKDEQPRYAATALDAGQSLIAKTTTKALSSKIGNQSAWFGTNKIDQIAFGYELVNNLRARQAAGILGAKSIGEGSVGITGRASFFLEEGVGDPDELFIPDTRTSITRVVEDAAGNAQIHHFPRVKITRSPRGASGGKDSDITVPLDFSVETDPTLGVMMVYAHYSV